MKSVDNKLRVFLCHAKEDKPTVRDLYRQLTSEGWMDIWLDELKLLPGQNWDVEIKRAVKQADVVIVCLSNRSVQKEGYVQKEMRYVLDVSEEKPEDTIFVIPVRLDDCSVPERIQSWHWIDYFPKTNQGWAYHQLIKSLKLRATKLDISVEKPALVRDKQEIKSELNETRSSNPPTPSKIEIPTQKPLENSQKEKKQKDANKKTELIDFLLLGGIIFLVAIGIILSGVYVFNNPLTTATPTVFPSPYTTPTESWIFFTPTDTLIFPTDTPALPTNATESNSTQPAATAIIDAAFSTQLAATATVAAALTQAVAAQKTIVVTPAMPKTGGNETTMISEKDGMTMVFVPAGEFTMGTTDSSKHEGYLIIPARQVYLDAYWIDQTEVTNGMYAKCVSNNMCTQPVYVNSETHSIYYGASEFIDYPVVYVDWDMARIYCEWAGRRLPTEAEWEKSARGTDGRLYPWGDTSPNDNILNFDGNVGDTTKVRTYESGRSPYGTYDMAGNVWEWVNDRYNDDTYYSELHLVNPLGPTLGEDRIYRGGSWNDNGFNALSAFNSWWLPSLAEYKLGFRCAKSAP